MPTERNLVLTGFMGTGKSRVGRIVANRLERPFVDMDLLLEDHFGKPIVAVFAEDGEEAFRAAEARICRELAGRSGLVIATGGGALVNQSSRDALAESGVLVCLTASVDAILERLGDRDDRPLLAGVTEQKQTRVRELMRQRRSTYAAIPHLVDTTGRDPEEIALLVMDAYAADADAPGATRILVSHPQGVYPIVAGDGLLSRTGALAARHGLHPGRVAVVTNAAIAALHFALLEESLRAEGYDPVVCLIPEGERHKTLATVQRLYEDFLDAHLDRHGAVLALGGGVVGDIAGFAAATYLRGVAFVQLPTTLLSMVDASVGGKTGVDLPQGKNLVGAFKQPEFVVLDTATLESLPAAEFRSGLAEVIKHGIIGDQGLFESLEYDGPATLTQMVVDAVRVKVQVVEEDPFEQGRRAVLNLGHTFGHALELESHFSIRHGEAVALGLIASARLAADLDCCPPELADRIAALVTRVGLPTSVRGYKTDAVMAAMVHDKKRAGKNLRFVVPRALGDVVVIEDADDAAVRRAMQSILTS